MRDGLLIHAGINFIFLPQAPVGSRKGIEFQAALLEQGIDIAKTQTGQDTLVLATVEPTEVVIQVTELDANIGQLLIVGSGRPGSVDLFGQQVEAIMKAYEIAFPTQKRQLISSDVTLRFLYETHTDHAFRELWERRLGQSRESLSTLGGPILGGGLRFVVPHQIETAEPCLVEVKIESFLGDTSKLYVETIFKWDLKGTPDTAVNAGQRLASVDRFVEENVGAFMDWEEN